MLEALVSPGPQVAIHEIPIPKPGPLQILTKVIVSGSNPKDWKRPEWDLTRCTNTNQGDDIAGIVEAVGDQVTEFRPGDRIAAFHHMQTPGGSYAEYALSPEHTTFHLPKTTSFEEAATIPLAAMTAAIGLFTRLGLPEPWTVDPEVRAKSQGGVVIYGGASAVGAFAIKLAMKAEIHPLICVAGKGIPFVEGLIDMSKGDVVLDYRKGHDSVVREMRAAVPRGEKLMYAFDCVSEKEKRSFDNICEVLDPRGRITVVLPLGQDYSSIPETVVRSNTLVGSVHQEGPDREFANAWFKLFAMGLKEGWFSGHPFEVVPGGLGGVQSGLRNLKEGRASAVKYVFRISETEGLSKS
jgi:NADPH:quinone reductase